METIEIASQMLFNVANSGNNLLLVTNEEVRTRHTASFASLIERREQIVFVLPGFPAKSPNREKTFGSLPDVAELISLERLNELCEYISSYYGPGARVMLCSDGHVFGDLVQVSDEDATAYGNRLRQIIVRYQLRHIDLFNMFTAFADLTVTEMRQRLVRQYGDSLEEIRNQVISNPDAQNKFNGIHRFVLEDSLALNQGKTKNQIRKDSKAIAYQVVQRSDSWGRLIKTFFPGTIRLSIHPQPAASERIFFQLANCANIWCTPWHSTAMMTSRGFCLIKRAEAMALGAMCEYTACGLPFFSLR